MKNKYESPEYWCGDSGYRAPGYVDFPINRIKEIAILLRKPRNVLDVGCAMGFSVACLRILGIEAWGLDISKYALSRAPEFITPFLFNASVCSIPLQDKSFDLIFSSGMLEHIPKRNLHKAINEIVRVGKRGLIGVSCLDDETTREGADDTHEVILKLREWQDLFPCDFEVVSDSSEAWNQMAQRDLAILNKLVESYYKMQEAKDA